MARRIRNWTGNFLATCVVLLLGIVFGRQVLEWWQGEPPSQLRPQKKNSIAGLGDLTDPRAAHFLEFGDLPITLRREMHDGDRQSALQRLSETCRQVAVGANVPNRTVLPFEARLLRRLRRSRPVIEGDGWKVFQNDGPILMVVAIRTWAPVEIDAGEGNGDTGRERESVVSWGLGLRQFVPSEEDATGGEGVTPERWTLFTYAASSAMADSGLDIALPIPPDSRRTLSVRVERGGALVGFVGQGSLPSWKKFFEVTFEERGKTRSSSWQQIGKNWHARFGDMESGSCDVQLTVETDDTLRGILTVAPATAGSGEDK